MKYHIPKMPLDTDNINKSSSATCGLDLICFFFPPFLMLSFIKLHLCGSTVGSGLPKVHEV